jgi:hypothetical protein
MNLLIRKKKHFHLSNTALANKIYLQQQGAGKVKTGQTISKPPFAKFLLKTSTN